MHIVGLKKENAKGCENGEECLEIQLANPCDSRENCHKIRGSTSYHFSSSSPSQAFVFVSKKISR